MAKTSSAFKRIGARILKGFGFSETQIVRWMWAGSSLSQTLGTPSYQSLAESGYMGNPDVYAVVSRITSALKGIPLRVYRQIGDGDDEREPVESSHPYQQLIRRPNKWLSGSGFIENLAAYHLIGGKAFIYRAQRELLGSGIPPVELYVLRPDLVTPKRGPSVGEVLSYLYRPEQGGSVEYEPDLMLYLPFFNPLSLIDGMSPMQAAFRGVDIGIAGRTWNYNLLANGARPAGVLTTEQGLTKEQREEMDAVIKARFSGPQKAGEIPVLEAGLEWKNLGFSPGEMAWKDTLLMSTRDICKVYNVAPELVGDSANKTYSNFQEARQALYQETVLPLLDFFCDEFNNWLSPLYGPDIVLGYDASRIEALSEDADKLWARLNQAWVLTPNQRLAAMGFEQSDDPLMDTVLVPSNLIPLEMAAGVIDDTGADEEPSQPPVVVVPAKPVDEE